jgi:hypothetical protein
MPDTRGEEVLQDLRDLPLHRYPQHSHAVRLGTTFGPDGLRRDAVAARIVQGF